MRNTCKVNVPRARQEGSPPFMAGNGNVFGRIPTKGAIADHSHQFVGLPFLYLIEEEVAREERGKRVGIEEEEEWLFVSFVIAIKNEMWSGERASIPPPLLDSVDSKPCLRNSKAWNIGRSTHDTVIIPSKAAY